MMRFVIGAILLLFMAFLVPWPDRSQTPAATPAPTPAPDLFASSVRPVLQARCAPCHEPGGQLYAKLPFDNAGVVAAHGPGVLKRLKGEDREAVERWLQSRAP